MTYENKKMLFESIMKDIAKYVKKKLNDFSSSTLNPFEAVDDFVTKFVHTTNKKLSLRTKEEIENLFSIDFVKRAASINRITHHPALKEDFTVDSFNEKFADVQKRLKILFDISDWEISVVDNFGTGQNDVNIVTVYD